MEDLKNGGVVSIWCNKKGGTIGKSIKLLLSNSPTFQRFNEYLLKIPFSTCI